MRIAALIVTYNRKNVLEQTLQKVLAEPFEKILIVDNASTDGTDAVLAALPRDARVHVQRLSENTGGAGGFAAGLATLMAQDTPPDWTVLFDDDAWPDAGAIDRFRSEVVRLAAQADPGAPLGAIAAAVTHPDGRISEMNRPGRNPFWSLSLFLRTALGRGRAGFHVTDTDLAADTPARPIDTASFVGFFVHRDAVARVGLPEAGLFIYGDDVLYSLTLRRAGFAIALAPAVRFIHDCATMDTGFVYRPLWKTYYHCRNGVSIARAAAGPIIFPAALLYYILTWWRRGRACPAPERPTYWHFMRTGLWDGIRHRRGRNAAVHARAARDADRLAEANASR